MGQKPAKEEARTTMKHAPYVHILDGRFRIRVPEVRGSSDKALALEIFLGNIEGVKSVQVSPITGSVLVHYDSSRIGHERIYDLIRSRGCLQRKPSPSTQKAVGALAEFVVQSAVESALRRLIPAVI